MWAGFIQGLHLCLLVEAVTNCSWFRAPLGAETLGLFCPLSAHDDKEQAMQGVGQGWMPGQTCATPPADSGDGAPQAPSPCSCPTPWGWLSSAWWNQPRAASSSMAWTSAASVWSTCCPSSRLSLKILSCCRGPSGECWAEASLCGGQAPSRSCRTDLRGWAVSGQLWPEPQFLGLCSLLAHRASPARLSPLSEMFLRIE